MLKCWVCGSYESSDSLRRHFDSCGDEHAAWTLEGLTNNTLADSWVGLQTTGAPDYSTSLEPGEHSRMRRDATIRSADELKYLVAQTFQTHMGSYQDNGFIIRRVELGSSEPRIPERNEIIQFQQLSRMEVLVPEKYFNRVFKPRCLHAFRRAQILLAERFGTHDASGWPLGNSVRVFACLILNRVGVLATRRFDVGNDAFNQVKRRPLRLRYVKIVVSRPVAAIQAPTQSTSLSPSNLTHGEAAIERNRANESHQGAAVIHPGAVQLGPEPVVHSVESNPAQLPADDPQALNHQSQLVRYVSNPTVVSAKTLTDRY